MDLLRLLRRLVRRWRRPELAVSPACVKHHLAHAASRGVEDQVCWRWPVQR